MVFCYRLSCLRDIPDKLVESLETQTNGLRHNTEYRDYQRQVNQYCR